MKVCRLLELLKNCNPDDEILIPCDPDKGLTNQIIMFPVKKKHSVENARHHVIAPAQGEWGEYDWEIEL